jgi:hypothetical protein
MSHTHNLFLFSFNVITVMSSRTMRRAEHVAQIGPMRNRYKIFVGKPEGKRIFGRHLHRWEDNMQLVQNVGCGVNLSGSGQIKVAGFCKYANEPYRFIIGGEFLS